MSDRWNSGQMLAGLVDMLTREEPWWTMEPRLKYIELRVDTRDGGFTLADRHGQPATIGEIEAAIAKWDAWTAEHRQLHEPGGAS